MRIDREMHIWAGCLISFAALILFEALKMHWMWVIVCVVGAALFKELKDWYDYGKFDLFDFIYTIAGGTIGITLAIFT